MMPETSRTLAANASILADISELSRIPVSPGFTWTTADGHMIAEFAKWKI